MSTSGYLDYVIFYDKSFEITYKNQLIKEPRRIRCTGWVPPSSNPFELCRSNETFSDPSWCIRLRAQSRANSICQEASLRDRTAQVTVYQPLTMSPPARMAVMAAIAARRRRFENPKRGWIFEDERLIQGICSRLMAFGWF